MDRSSTTATSKTRLSLSKFGASLSRTLSLAFGESSCLGRFGLGHAIAFCRSLVSAANPGCTPSNQTTALTAHPKSWMQVLSFQSSFFESTSYTSVATTIYRQRQGGFAGEDSNPAAAESKLKAQGLGYQKTKIGGPLRLDASLHHHQMERIQCHHGYWFG